MRMKLTATITVLLFAACAYAQTRKVTDSGVYVADASGRYVRLEGRDGVVVNYLYDKPGTRTSGLAVKVRDGLTLTVRYHDGTIAVAGLPKLKSTTDRQGRTSVVRANGKPVAGLYYSDSGYVAAVALPGRLAWRLSAPDAAHRVRQSVENAIGQVTATGVVTTRMDLEGIRTTSWDALPKELGAELSADLRSATWQRSPTGALTTGRDAKGRVIAYVVHTDTCDVGFSPDGRPRFYDLRLSVHGGHIAPGGDAVTSAAWQGQRGTIPDHLVLTARGGAGLYVEESVDEALYAVWMDGAGVHKASTRK